MTKEEVQELISDRLWRLSLACADDHGAMKRLASILQRLDFEGRSGCHRAHPHEDMSAECEAKTEKARADAKVRVEEAKERGAVNWPAKPQLPSLILITAYNNGPLVELQTAVAREQVLLDYADEVKKTAHALVDAARALFEDEKEKAVKIAEERGRALEQLRWTTAYPNLRTSLLYNKVDGDAPPPSHPHPHPQEATGVGSVVGHTGPTSTPPPVSATMQVMAVEDVAGYVQAARRQAFEKAMEIIAEYAKAAQDQLASHHDAGAFEAELRLRRAWEAVRAASANP